MIGQYKIHRLVLLLCACALIPHLCEATPQFARAYRVDCSHCHSAPPRLNERGIRFVAEGYRLEGRDRRSPTMPLAVWNTVDLEARHSTDLAKAFASRVELISAGPVGSGGASYFVEWRALSQSLAGDGRLLNRSGRFEDLFVRAPLTPGGALSVTTGQFRALAQVDVSLRLSLSEPLVFGSSVPGRRASEPRLTALRAFSASGRQPAVRVEYQGSAATPGDGWFAAATLPLTGELTIPLANASSFELEGRPKGVFLEAFHRRGLTSVGGHAFVGDEDRRVVTGVVTHDLAGRVALVGGLGVFHARGVTDTRLSVAGEATLSAFIVGGVRVDHRTRQGRDPAVLLYVNGHLPFGPAGVRQALRLQIEHRIQRANHVTGFAISHVF